MNMPILSIVMSAYNPSAFDIGKTIQSVLSQTFTDFEFLIIKDDARTETLQILKGWEKKDLRIKIIDNMENIGLITSLNKGLDNAKGTLIARIDVGDWWEPSKLQQQFDLFQSNSELYLCGTALKLVDEHYDLLGLQSVPILHTQIVSSLMNAKNPFAHSSVMFRKTSLRYNPNALYCEDFELWCRYSRLGKMANIDEPLTHYVLNTSGITNQKRSLMIENMTRAYCSFLEALQNNDLSFIRDGLPIISQTSISALQVKSNQWYSKAILSSLRYQKIQSTCYFLLAVLLNPALLWNRLKRIYCKSISGKTI